MAKNGKTRFKLGFSVHLMFHSPGFAIDRPRGVDEYIFLHYIAPAKITLRGKTLRLPPDTCFIFSPRTPQLYSGDGVGLGNNAFHFDGPEVAKALTRHKIPVNKPIRVENATRIAEITKLIHEEYLNRDKHSDASAGKLFDLLCLELVRQRQRPAKKGKASPRLKELRTKLAEVRAEMLRHLEGSWTLRTLEKAAGLGRSRLCALYKAFFGKSPIDELIEFRLRKAEYLLSSGSCTVSEAAAACGFHSLHYFCRLFKRRTGSSPGQQLVR